MWCRDSSTLQSQSAQVSHGDSWQPYEKPCHPHHEPQSIISLVIYCKNVTAAPKRMAITSGKLLFLWIAAGFFFFFAVVQWTCRRCNFSCSKQVIFHSLHCIVIPVMGIAETKNFRSMKLDYFSNYNIVIKRYIQCHLYIMFLYIFLDLTWFIWAQGNWFHFYSYLGIWQQFSTDLWII